MRKMKKLLTGLLCAAMLMADISTAGIVVKASGAETDQTESVVTATEYESATDDVAGTGTKETATETETGSEPRETESAYESEEERESIETPEETESSGENTEDDDVAESLEGDENEVQIRRLYSHVTFINPVYESVINEDDLRQVSSENELQSASVYSGGTEYIATIEEAGRQMRESLKGRVGDIKINYKAPGMHDEASIKVLMADIFDCALEHTGNGMEGDYIKFQYGGWNAAGSSYIDGGNTYVSINYAMTYYTTDAQEKSVDEKVRQVMEGLALDGKDDYQKAKAIYDYVCGNVTYDYANLNDKSYLLKYTAYAALVDKTAVCQGYANLMYRLCLECGIDTRIIAGLGNGEAHAWNIAKKGDAYYCMDATWDAGRVEYSYFLKGKNNFTDHQADEYYLSDAFTSKYVISDIDAAESGKILTWQDYAAGSFSGGSGTKEDPYQISSSGELALLAKKVNKADEKYNAAYYILMNDIDLSDHGWMPIGNGDNIFFSGTFDGGNHKITNLHIEDDLGILFYGLFGKSSGSIRNVELKNEKIIVDSSDPGWQAENGMGSWLSAGGLVGYHQGREDNVGGIENCVVEANIEVKALMSLACGTAIGEANYASFKSCKAVGNVAGVSARAIKAGGFVGSILNEITIEGCSFEGKVSSVNDGVITEFEGKEEEGFSYSNEAGGFAGNMGGGTYDISVKKCSARGRVEGTSHKKEAAAGGFAGEKGIVHGKSYYQDLYCDTTVLINDINGLRETRYFIPDNVIKPWDEIDTVDEVVIENCFARGNKEGEIYIPYGVMSIGSFAFAGLGSMNCLYIPSSVLKIKDSAFSGCSSLTDVYYAESELKWSEIEIGSSNECLSNATIHYYGAPKLTFTVNFDLQGKGTALEEYSGYREISGGSTIDRPTPPAAEGWKFTGWYKEKECKNLWSFETDKVNYNATLYAGWENGEGYYDVDFNLQGHGTGTEEYTKYKHIKGGSQIEEPPAPNEDGYKFKGWYKEAECQTLWKFDSDTVEQDVTLYAGWEKEIKYYKVTFNLQGHGTESEEYTKYNNIKEGSQIEEPPAPQEEGYKFTGWYKEAECKTLWKFDSDTVDQDVTLYAGWEEEQDIIPDGIWAVPIKDYTYMGKAIVPSVKVYYNRKKLTEGRDYTLTYQNNTKASTATRAASVIIRGKGNYTDTKRMTFAIKKAQLTESENLRAAKTYPVGVKYTPTVVTGGNVLKVGTDYTLTYMDASGKKLNRQPTQAGSYQMHIVGKGNCEGVIDFQYEIAESSGAVSISKGTATVSDMTYGGKEPDIALSVNGKQLVKDTDYMVHFANTDKKGTAYATLVGIGNYTGMLNKSFRVKAAVLREGDIDVPGSTAYEKGGARAKVTVTVSGVGLTEGTDYTVSYKNNTKIGVATATVKGKGNYTGSIAKKFSVEAQSIGAGKIYVSDALAGKSPAVTIYDANGKKMSAPGDYKAVIDKDARTVTLSGGKNGLYRASEPLVITYNDVAKGKQITSVSLDKNASGLPKYFEYTGKEILLEKGWLKVKAGNTVLKGDEFEIIGYVNNVGKGTATVIVRGANGYGGIKMFSFRIKEKRLF